MRKFILDTEGSTPQQTALVMAGAVIADGCRRGKVANQHVSGLVLLCTTILLASGCSLIRAPVAPDPVVEPAEPSEPVAATNERVVFTPASGTVATGKTATVTVEIQRDPNACSRVLRLAMLRTAQGSSNITVNYVNTGRAKFQID